MFPLFQQGMPQQGRAARRAGTRCFGLAAVAAAAAVVSLAPSGAARGAVSLPGGVYVENFDSMGPSGTVPPTDWTVTSSAGTNPPNPLGLPSSTVGGIANNGYNAGQVAGNAGDADRALGVFGGATGDPRQVSATFVNNSAGPVSSFDVTYDIEAWYFRFNSDSPRSGGFNLNVITGAGSVDAGTTDGAVTNATVTEGATWLSTPVSLTGLGGTVTLATPIGVGESFTLQWNATVGEPEPAGAANSRHTVIAVDNVALDFGEPIPEPGAAALIALAGAGFLVRRRRGHVAP